MKLYVQVVEARDLYARDPNGFSDPFVRLSLGNTKARTSVVHKNLNPSWNEDFFFNVTDLDQELKVTVWDEDRFTDDFLGLTKISVAQVLSSEQQSIPHSWYRLQKKNDKSKIKVSGELLLDISLFGRTFNAEEEKVPRSKVRPLELTSSPSRPSVDSLHDEPSVMSITDSATSESSDLLSELETRSLARTEPSQGTVLNSDAALVQEFTDLDKKKTAHGNAIAERLTSIFQKKGRRNSSRTLASPSSSVTSDFSGEIHLPADAGSVGTADASLVGTDGDSESDDDEHEVVVPLSFFQDDEKSVGESPEDLPPPLPGGVLVDQSYAVSMKALNSVLFRPDSTFLKELVELQKTTELEEGPWTKTGNEPMKRNVRYRKAPSRLVKAVVANEWQTYQRADDKGFVVFCSVATPDVPYGKNFLCELLFIMTPGPALPTGEMTSRLNISWRMNFLQSTVMRGMIVNGASQGLKESYTAYQELLAKHVKPLDGAGPKDDEIEEAAIGIPKTDWELAREYFGNYTVLLSVVGLSLILFHIFLVKTRGSTGLQFWIFDLPDSFGELVTVAFLTRQVEQVGRMVQKFLTARLRAGDHGVKAQGDGWLLTVTLVEAQDLYSIDSDGSCDPYVVFTCNGKIRTSSVILGSISPQWKEVYEFDATEDPPSIMDVEVFDYDGPFAEAESLGHSVVNFLKTKSEEYCDVWLPLSGKFAQSHGSKLHLRILLTNNRTRDHLPEYMNKVEREAGTKIVKRSPQQNATFQKLFSLPQEEFLINDYACAIKRKIPIQGRLFLSPRMLGFYSNLFGHKTKFSFLWEDIEEIKEAAPTRGALFNPSLTITLRKGRAVESRQGSKGVDNRGRLRFQFLSFVRPGPAFRTIIALWKNRALSVEQTLELIASVESGDMRYQVAERQADDSQPFLGLEDAYMSQLEDVEFPATLKQLAHLVEFGALDHQIMELVGVNNYKATHWENVGGDTHVRRRQVSYVMNRHQCRFVTSVTAIQQRTIAQDSKSGLFEELLTLHDVPFGDHFQVQVRRETTDISESPPLSHIKIFAGVAWHKNAGFQKKMTKNIISYMSQFMKEYVSHAKQIVKDTPPEALQPLHS